LNTCATYRIASDNVILIYKLVVVVVIIVRCFVVTIERLRGRVDMSRVWIRSSGRWLISAKIDIALHSKSLLPHHAPRRDDAGHTQDRARSTKAKKYATANSPL